MRHVPAIIFLLMVFAPVRGQPVKAQDFLAKSRAAYAALKSYSDTGTVTVEFGSAAKPSVERHSFTTYYRAPRHFYFEFREDKNAGGDRFVVWNDGSAFYTWWATTGVKETYPPGRGAGAFAGGVVQTAGSLLQIAPLLFPQAGLQGALTEIADSSVTGEEQIAGRRTHKLVGEARSTYQATGHVTNRRRTTVWVDAESLMVRRILEDTPEGQLSGVIRRVTTMFEPEANPLLDENRFQFVVPIPGK